MTGRGGTAEVVNTVCGFTFGSGRNGRSDSVNSALIFSCGAPDRRSVATYLFCQKTQLFQDHSSRLKGTKYEVETAAESPVFAEFVAALEGRRSEVKMRNIDGLPAFCSEFGFEEFLTVLDVFEAVLPLAGVSLSEDESLRSVHDIEEKNQQIECNFGLLKQEFADLRGAHSSLAVENKAQKQEMDALLKWKDELVARFGQAKSRSDEAIKCILQEFETLRKQNHAPSLQKQFPFNNRGETPVSRVIWELMGKSSEANKRVFQESWRRQSSAAMVLAQKFLGLSFVRSMRSAQDGAVFFGSAGKDSETTKQKNYGYLTGGGLQPRKADFAGRSGIFRLRDGSLTSKDLLEVAIPGTHVFAPDGAHRIGIDFAEDCQGSVETFLCIKRLIGVRYAGVAVGVRLDIGSGSIAIPTDSNRMLILYSSAESLRIPDWIKIIHADDFRFCPNLREVIAGLQREIGGFRDCRKLERVELSRSVEVVGISAFNTDEDEGGSSAEARRARRPLFLTVGDESWLRKRRRGCHVFIAGKGAKKEEDENRQFALSGIVSHLTTKCGGNVHDKGIVEITASSVSGTAYPQNSANLEDNSWFWSENEPS
jgi:hypothetical protein